MRDDEHDCGQKIVLRLQTVVVRLAHAIYSNTGISTTFGQIQRLRNRYGYCTGSSHLIRRRNTQRLKQMDQVGVRTAVGQAKRDRHRKASAESL